jgi:argininosuccinate lyase
MSKTEPALQWGGRFAGAPDAALLAFGSSLEDDLVLAAFDVACSQAHVATLAASGVIDVGTAHALSGALQAIADEIPSGEFAAQARALGAEDVHGAIDGRVRALAPAAGEWLHAGRSRNDQVATTLALYARDRALRGVDLCEAIARVAIDAAKSALKKETVLAATTHWQPAQPILLAFWLGAIAEMFVRARKRLERVAADAREACPLGSGACSGSTLPLERKIAAQELDFVAPSRNALDSVGDRDVALDVLHAVTRAVVAASRVSEELVIWCTPAFGYARLDDAASTGSSLMPQKRNPDPFELVRAAAAVATGTYASALASLSGVALSYHRDLQETKAQVIRGTERGLAALAAFAAAMKHVNWNAEAMAERAGDGYVVATDIADALIARGISPRQAHLLVGNAVSIAERDGRPLGTRDLTALAKAAKLKGALKAPLGALESVRAKKTAGSTSPESVARALAELEATLAPKGSK